MIDAPTEHGWIGRSVPRLEDRRLLTGAARFVADLDLPRMLEMHVLRSPHAHARLVSVDPSALGDRVVDFLSAADLPDAARAIPISSLVPGMHDDSFPTLPRDKVRYVGQPIAALLATNRYAAEDAGDVVRVEYEALPAIVDMDAALEPDATLLHPDWGSNLAFRTESQRGDLSGAFASSDVVIQQRVSYPRHACLPLETRGLVASYDAGLEQLTLWLSTQSAHAERGVLAGLLGLPESRLRVIAPHVGGAFGCKLHSYPEYVLGCLFALRTGRPVRWVEDRREHLLSTIHAREQRIDLEIAARQDGLILGVRARVRADVGAHIHSRGAAAATVTMRSIPGPYQFGAYGVVLEGVVTNKMPFGAYRGFGKPQAAFAMERGVDALADRLGMDPAEVRRRNLIRADQMPYDSVAGRDSYDSGDYPEALRRALALVGWDARREEHAARRGQGVLRGVGVAFSVESTSVSSQGLARAGRREAGYESTSIRITPQGAITLACGLMPSGQGHETMLAQICATELGVRPTDVRVVLGDSELCPYSGYGTAASRGTTTAGGSALLAARKMRDKVLAVAGHLLEADPCDLVVEDGQVGVRGDSTRRLDLAQIAFEATIAQKLPAGMEPGLEVLVTFDPPQTVYSYAANACEVEVDPATGAIALLQYVVVDDCGTMVNPMLVDGQIAGAVAQGIGGTLYEDLHYDENGQLLTTSLMDYLVPTACEVPAIRTAHMVTPSPYIPGGFKGIGEGGTIAVPAALANAVMDALRPAGAAANALPLTPERVLELVRCSPFAESRAPERGAQESET